MKSLTIIILVLLNSSAAFCQPELSRQKLEDLTDRAIRQVELFQNYVQEIGAARYPVEIRMESIELCKKLFTKEAIIQEQGKRSKKPKNWQPPEEYLIAMLDRGSAAPVIVEFDMVDELSTDELKKTVNPDGTVSYKGDMVFRQYYCKLNKNSKLLEPSKDDPNVNCVYHDVTEKKVTVEIMLYESSKGKFWITLITNIEVLSVK